MKNNLQNMNKQKLPIGIKVLAIYMALGGILAFLAPPLFFIVKFKDAPPWQVLLLAGLSGILYFSGAIFLFKAHRFGWWITFLSSWYTIGMSFILVLPFHSPPRSLYILIPLLIVYCLLIWYLSRQKVRDALGVVVKLPQWYLTSLVFFILLLPLVNLPPWFAPPEWGKSITFRVILSAILFLLLLISFAHDRLEIIARVRQRIQGAKIGLFLLAGLFCAFLLASVFSFDPNFSFWGNPERGGGSITFLLLILSCALAYILFSKKHWNYAWIMVFITAFLVSLVAIAQWRGWFPDIITHRPTRPQSTLGNDIQLGMYLLLLVFPAIAFALGQKKHMQKIPYLLALLAFLLVIMLTGSRGAYLGIILAFSYFMLFFPVKKLAHSLLLKCAFFVLVLIPGFAVYYANTHEVFPDFIQKNPTWYAVAGRLQLKQFLISEPRFSTWKVGWEAIQSRPLLGYGPENFEIGFDKYYDPKLPNIQYGPKSPNSWWDKAHNIFIDIASQAGIPALFFYTALIGVLLWQLQKIKPKEPLLAHGLQAAFIGYLGANLFGFDNFSTLLVFFFLIAYALHLTSKTPEVPYQEKRAVSFQGSVKIFALAAAACLLAVFNWQFNIRPFLINSNIQFAKALVRVNHCGPAFSYMEKALKKGSTFLDAYVKVTYFDALRNCQTRPEDTVILAKRSHDLLVQAVKAWPYHTRTWIFLGQMTALVAERDATLTPQEKQTLLKEAESYFERAKELSPKHQELYLEWAKIHITSQDYERMAAIAQECIVVYPQTGECWFLKGLAHEFMKQNNEFKRYEKMARNLGYNPDKDIIALGNLEKVYSRNQNLGDLAQTYEKLVIIKPNVPQFYASLAFTYASLGEYQKARQAALKVLELDPDAKAEVEEFLRMLP